MSITAKSLSQGNYYTQCRLEGHRNTALLIGALSPFSRLRNTMMGCGQPSEHKVAEPCRKIGCQRCREKCVHREVDKAVDLFGSCSNSEMAFATVVLGATCNVGDIKNMFAKARRQLRSVIDRRRRAKPRWNDIEVLGWMEVDLVEEDQLDAIGTQRRSLIDQVGLPTFIRGRPIWVVTFHGVVRLVDRVDRYSFAEALKEVWPEERQVHVEPFLEEKSLRQNLNSLVRYCLKFKCETNLPPVKVGWRPERIAEFYEFMAGWSRGFQRCKISIGPKGLKRTVNDRSNSYAKTVSRSSSLGDGIDGFCEYEVIEPMPILIA